MAGRSVVARFSVTIERLLDEALELLAGVECNNTAGGDRDLFSRLWIAPGPLRVLAELKISESRQLHHFTPFEGNPDLLEKGLHHVLGLALVQAHLLEHEVG